MSLSEELAALRARGTVKATSSSLSSSLYSTTFNTPQQQELLRKQKALEEKRLREDAERNMRRHGGGRLEDLMYLRLKELKRSRRKGIEKSAASSSRRGGEKNTDDNSDNRKNRFDHDHEEEDDENQGLLDTLEMLPHYIVTELKLKFETDNAVEALDMALKEEEEGKGRYISEVIEKLEREGVLNRANVMDKQDGQEEVAKYHGLTTNILDNVKGEIEPANEKEKSFLVDKTQPSMTTPPSDDSEKIKVSVNDESVSAEIVMENDNKIANNYRNEEIKMGEKKEPSLILEEVMTSVIEKLSLPSVDFVKDEREVEEEYLNPEAVVEIKQELVHETVSYDGDVTHTTNSTIVDTCSIKDTICTPSKEIQIELTKAFYNKFTHQYVLNIDQSTESSHARASHRNAFISYMQQEHMLVNVIKKNATSPLKKMAKSLRMKKNGSDVSSASSTAASTSSTIASNYALSLQIIDLGCGDGRDTVHFASLGHHVLSIDYSTSMLQCAKENVSCKSCNAHYLNVDMRFCSAILLDQSVDGIWASASLIHLPKGEMRTLLNGLYSKVKVGGVLYFNLKVGDAGETFESDNDSLQKQQKQKLHANEVMNNSKKLCSYYTLNEVKEMLDEMEWEVLEMGENDPWTKGDKCTTHSWMYVFAIRRNE